MYYIWFSFKKEKLYYNIWEVILGFGELIVMIYAILNFLAWVKGFNIQGNFFCYVLIHIVRYGPSGRMVGTSIIFES